MSSSFYRDVRPINGTFKGRGRDYLTLLACPEDGAALTVDDAGLRCTADPAHCYPFEDGILRLVHPDRRVALADLSAEHEAACTAAGWKVPDEDEFKALPQSGLSGYPLDYWDRRAAGTALLWRFLEAVRLQAGRLPIGPMGEAAVVSAGSGWLAYGLDVAGFTTLAIDTRVGPRYGLGAYAIARYFRVQADLPQLPLARGAFDWIIFQEGLAGFGGDAQQRAALDAALRALRPGGWLAVMQASAVASENGAADAQPLLEQVGLALLATPHRLGWRGRLFEMRDRLSGAGPDLPPVLVAQKPI